MIYINYQGRLGNNLFQYAIAKILSNKYNQLIYNPLNNSIVDSNNYGQDTKFLKTTEITDDNFLEIDNETLLYSNIYLNGFFQNYHMVKLLEQNLNLFYHDSHYIDGLFVHVRLGDIEDETDKIPTYKYYYDSIASSRRDINYISTDSPNHSIVKKLIQEFNLTPYNNTPENTIKFASKFTYKILSLGTFSWWIGFLGCNNKIFCPNPLEYTKWHGDIFPIREWITISK